MSIVLTGDVHQYFGGLDQEVVDTNEAALSVTYAQIAASYGLNVTLFFAARALIEDGEDAGPLLKMSNVEIGGHGWDSLQPRLWHGLLNRTLGSPHGPIWLQRRMIRRTCATISAFSGAPVRSWRNHAYRHDEHTPRLLHDAGIRVWSDRVEPERLGPYEHESGVVVLPINTMPDHENLYHGRRTQEFVARDGSGPSYSADVWLQTVCTQVETIVAAGGRATILAHPACMKIADDWQTFARLCAFLSEFESLTCAQCVPS